MHSWTTRISAIFSFGIVVLAIVTAFNASSHFFLIGEPKLSLGLASLYKMYDSHFGVFPLYLFNQISFRLQKKITHPQQISCSLAGAPCSSMPFTIRENLVQINTVFLFTSIYQQARDGRSTITKSMFLIPNYFHRSSAHVELEHLRNFCDGHSRL